METDENGDEIIFQKGPHKITVKGVFKRVKGKEDQGLQWVPISDIPCTLTAIGDNLDTGEILYKLSIINTKKREKIFWKKSKDLLTREGALELISDGMNFNDTECKDITAMFKAYLHEVTPDLPEELAASRSGWKQNGDLFVVGDCGYTKDAITQVLQLENNTAELYTQKGTVTGWKEGVVDLVKYEAVRFKMYAACTPLILSIISVPSFLFEQIGVSGLLKTLSSEVAASIFGNPKTLQLNAKSTPKGIEAFVGYNTNLPVFIDETSTNPEDIKDMVYTIANGVGRGTSNKSKGYDMPKTWLTVVLTTGENPILPRNAKMGEFVRDIPLRGGVSEMLDQCVIAKIEDAIQDNHGVIRDLILNEIFESKDVMRKIYNEYYNCFPDPDEKNITSSRAKKFYAAIATAGYLLESVFGSIGIKQMDPFDVVNKYFVENVIASTVFVPDHKRAMDAFYSWFAGNRVYFDDPKEDSTVNHERYGWVRDNKICITEEKLSEIIKKYEYNYSGCLSEWKKDESVDIRVHKKGDKEYKEHIFDISENKMKYRVIKIPARMDADKAHKTDGSPNIGKAARKPNISPKNYKPTHLDSF